MQRLGGFARATGGQAALEFAILLPMMVFLLFGSVDLLDMLQANRRAQNVAASVADVMARDTGVSTAELQEMWAAIDVLMFPNDSSTMKIRITSVRIESATRASVVWSAGHNGMAPLGTNSTVGLHSAMMQPGTSLIMTDTEYSYRSALGFLNSGPVTMTHRAFRRSRLVDPIPREA